MKIPHFLNELSTSTEKEIAYQHRQPGPWDWLLIGYYIIER